MPGPQFYSSVDTTSGVATGTALSSEFSCFVSDGTRNVVIFYFNSSDNVTSVTSTGTDQMISTMVGATSVSIAIPYTSPVANHKTKKIYSFNVNATSEAGTTTVSVTATVKAQIPLVISAQGRNADGSYKAALSTPSNTILIEEGVKEGAVKLSCDEIELATYELAIHVAGSDENDLVTMTTGGVISLGEISSSSISPYRIKVVATSGYGPWESGYTNVVNQTVTINVTDGNPVFLDGINGYGGAVKSTSYSYTVDDSTKFLSDSGNIYMNDLCFFDISGTDASYFSITPKTGSARARSATLSLTNNASYQTKSSYSLSVTATDSTSNSSSRNITVTINSDLVKPNIILSSVGAASLDDSTTVSISDTFLAGDFAKITADENCTSIVITGTDSSGFAADFTQSYSANVLTITSKGQTRNSQKSYSLIATATDSSPQANTNTLNFTIKVVDKSKPVITVSSPQVSGNGATNVFTNATTVQVIFSSDEPLSTSFLVSNFSIATTSDAFIDQSNFSGNTNGATLIVKIPVSSDANVQAEQENKVITITLAANTVHDANNSVSPYNTNHAVTFEFQYKFDPNANGLQQIGSLNTTVPQGRFYVDGGLIGGSSNVITTSTVNVKVAGQYHVTYKYTSPTTGYVTNLVRTVIVSTSDANYRPKPIITTKGLSPNTYTLMSPDFSNTDEAATNVNPILNSNNAPIVIMVTNNISMSTMGTYTVFYNGSDDVYGALVQLLRSVAVGTFTGTASFFLSGLSSAMTLSAGLSEASVVSASDSTMDSLPGVKINMPASAWNSIFYLRPKQDSSDGGSGLSDLSDLANINVFTTDTIDYRTDSTKVPLLTGVETATITLGKVARSRTGSAYTGTINNVGQSPNQTISEAVTNRFSYDIFGQEFTTDIANIFGNLSAVKAEINLKLTTSTAGTLDAGLKSAVSAAPTTNAETGINNLTRQLMLQLHAQIAPNGIPGNEAYRLTKTGIFGSPEADGYFPFIFLAGDKLTVKMTITHPVVTPTNYYMLNGTQLAPQPVVVRVEITMTA